MRPGKSIEVPEGKGQLGVSLMGPKQRSAQVILLRFKLVERA